MKKNIKISLVLSSLILGTVSLTADIINTNNNTNGIYKESVTTNETIQNNAKISVTDNYNAEAIELGDVSNNSKIINTGTIEAFLITDINNDDDAAGIRMNTVTDSTITNSGTITTSVNIAGSKSLSVGINPTELYNSTITNSGTIKSTIANKLDSKGMAIVIDDVKNSIITNTSSGKIYGNVVFLESDANTTFKNEGFISLPYNANKYATFSGIDDDGEKFSVNLQANIPNLINSGTIEIGAFKNSNNVIENTQIKTINATFEAGSQMQVAVVEGSKAFVLNDTLSEVVTATNELKGFGNIVFNPTKVADNSAILDFELKYDELKKQIDLVVAKVESIKDIVTKPETGNKPNNVNAGNIGAVLDYIRENQDKYPNMGNIISKLDSLSSNKDIVKAVNSLLGISSTSLIKISDAISSNISNVVSNRLGNIQSGINSGDEMIIDNNKLWAKAYGSIGKQYNKDDISGFDLKTYGLGLGYDKEYKDGQIFGLGAFYTNADVEINGVNHKNDADAYSIVAYGSNLLKDDKTTIYYQTSHTWQKNDSKRDLFTGERADAKFTSKTFTIESKVGHKIALGEKASIEPNIGLSYRHFKNPSYNENGSSANLKSEKFSNTELLGKVGVEFDYKLTSRSKLTANIGAGYNFHNSKNKVTSSFEGASGVTFDSKGIDNGKWKYEAGLGYAMDINSKNNLGINYKFVGEGSKFRNNILSVNYNYKF